MDDLIPILIVILISVVGALGKRKRQRDQRTVGQGFRPAAEQEELPEWFRRFIPEAETNQEFESDFEAEEKPVSAKPRPEPAVQEAQTAKPGVFDRFSGFITSNEREGLMKQEGQRAIVQQAATKVPEPLSEAEPSVRSSILKRPIDLKEAVIYSEILNRKY